MEYLLPLGKANFRGKEIEFGIKKKDRRRHIYIIGKTGQGKTTLLENMILSDIQNNAGVAYLDPHGDSVQRILDYIPKERIDDVIYLNLTDVDHPFAFNPLEKVSWEQRHFVALSLVSIFKKIWVDAWSARMEYILTNALLALLEWPGATLLDVNRLLADDNFRRKIIETLKDPIVRAFWINEFSKYHLQFRIEAIAPIQNKVGQFITNPLIRNIIGQTESSFDLREIMDTGKILLVNLSVGAIGEETSSLLGGLLITKLQLAAMSRVDIPEEQRKDFYLYIDEFQNFSTESFVNILSEARKYRLCLILAHQYLDQVDEKIIKAVFGNIGTFIVFRLGTVDAEVFAKEFGYYIKPEEFLNLPSYYIYVKLLIDGQPTNPFLATTFPPKPKPEISYKEEIINLNHLKYAKRRSVVEGRIAKIYTEIAKEGKNLVYCRKCGQAFLSEKGIEICEDCEAQVEVKISLKRAIEGGLIEPTRQRTESKKESLSLDEILKKLQNE